MSGMASTTDYFFSSTIPFQELFKGKGHIWDVLDDLPQFLESYNDTLIHPSATIHPSASIRNCIIGKNSKIYEGVTLRDSVIGENCVIGHCSEIARSIILNNVSIPRFDYVGSSLIGNNVRLGGMVSLASRRYDSNSVSIFVGTDEINTNKAKLGSVIGDNTIVGYGTHINPGVLIGPNCLISALCDIRVFIPRFSRVILKQQISVISANDEIKSGPREIITNKDSFSLDSFLSNIIESNNYNKYGGNIVDETELKKDLGMDSLDFETLTVQIEQMLGIQIHPFERTMQNFKTIASLKALINSKLNRM